MAAIVTGGIASLKIDNVPYMVRGSMKLKPQTSKRTPIANMDGSVVNTETATVPQLALTLSDWKGFSLAQLYAIAGQTIAVTSTTGKTYSLPNAFQIDESELDFETGGVTVAFAGDSVAEIGVSTV